MIGQAIPLWRETMHSTGQLTGLCGLLQLHSLCHTSEVCGLDFIHAFRSFIMCIMFNGKIPLAAVISTQLYWHLLSLRSINYTHHMPAHTYGQRVHHASQHITSNHITYLQLDAFIALALFKVSPGSNLVSLILGSWGARRGSGGTEDVVGKVGGVLYLGTDKKTN